MTIVESALRGSWSGYITHNQFTSCRKGELTLDKVKVKIADLGKGHLDSPMSSHN